MGCLSYVIRHSNSNYSFIFKLCISQCLHIADVRLLYYMLLYFGSVELIHYYVYITLRVLIMCKLLLQQFLFLFIQTVQTDFRHIEDVYLLFCAVLIYIFIYVFGC